MDLKVVLEFKMLKEISGVKYKSPDSLNLERIQEGVTIQQNGNDAEVTINGMLIKNSRTYCKYH